MKFPTQWPDDCPPPDAVDADGEVFRLAKNDPPTPEDFVTHFESGRLPKAPACLRGGLSVFRELGDAIHLRSLFPKLGKKVARGTLHPSHGKAKLTPSRQPTHTTWWPYEQVDRCKPFAIVKEGG